MSRHRLRIWAIGLIPLLLVAVVVAVVLSRREGPDGPVNQARPGPVLLVAGFGGNVQSMQTLADAMRARGRDAVIVPITGDNTGDLEEQAAVSYTHLTLPTICSV